MPPQYTPITIEQMHAYITPLGFEQIIDQSTREYVYEKQIDHKGKVYKLRVYTSLDRLSDVSRMVGTDAIRVILLNDKNWIVSAERRVNRTQNWQKSLKNRIDNWQDGAYWCPQCGNLLKIRKGKFGPFMGCSTFPQCGFTQPIPKKEKDMYAARRL